MTFTVYILYSDKAKKFYTGYTSMLIEDRVRYHNYNNRGFTRNHSDWKIFHTETFLQKEDAMRKEMQIKKRGAKRYLQDLY